jgi:hypothetical protein
MWRQPRPGFWMTKDEAMVVLDTLRDTDTDDGLRNIIRVGMGWIPRPPK